MNAADSTVIEEGKTGPIALAVIAAVIFDELAAGERVPADFGSCWIRRAFQDQTTTVTHHEMHCAVEARTRFTRRRSPA